MDSMDTAERRPKRTRKAVEATAAEMLTYREEKEMRLAIEKSMEEIQAPVGLSAIEAPTFRPSLKEFSNPIAYIVSIRDQVASNGGIAKIVPPEGWACPFDLDKSGLNIETKEQTVNKLGEGVPYGTGAEYNFDTYKAMAEAFRDRWVRKLVERGEDPDDYKAWERAYWRIVEGGEDEDVVVEYGNDVSTEVLGGGFPKLLGDDSEEDDERSGGKEEMWIGRPDFTNNEYYARTEWNLSNIAWARKSVLGNIKDLINGINVPWLYFGMTFATFSWHVEDNWLYSINYHHHGHPKLWYGLGPEYQHRFKQVLKQMMPIRFREQPDLLSDITTMVNPTWLLNRNIQVHTILQQPGEFVITLPGAYHGGFSLGFNVGEAVNFAPIDWITPGRLCRDVYRSESRPPVIAHDKVVWGLVNYSAEFTKPELELLIKELHILVKSEQDMRSHAARDGVSFTVIMPPEDSSSDESDLRRACVKCNQPCSLHAVVCNCSPDRTACGSHQRHTCSCPASKKALVTWATIDQLLGKIRKLELEVKTRFGSS